MPIPSQLIDVTLNFNKNENEYSVTKENNFLDSRPVVSTSAAKMGKCDVTVNFKLTFINCYSSDSTVNCFQLRFKIYRNQLGQTTGFDFFL